jgi:hypothetical protein
MKTKLTGFTLLLLLFACTQPSTAAPKTEVLARLALSESPAKSAPAIAELRAAGPAGLRSLFELYGPEIKRQVANPSAPTTPEWQRLSAALDAVSQQKNSYLSGLYWYTDLAQAEAAAKSSGKPILSLRLLGRLNEEFSCANSRYFRTVLYSNVEVSQALRERFILHWQSVRPAPRVTIDFGDGRKLERTITGNSIHYVLNAEGQVIDTLPGLYGPGAFLRAAPAQGVSQRVKGMTREVRWTTLSDYHRQQLKTITASWIADTANAGGKIPETLLPKQAFKSGTAIAIAPLAVTKGYSEVTILRGITKDADALGAVMDELTWTSIARRRLSDARLDQHSVGLIRRQMQKLWEADKSTSPKQTLDGNLMKLLLKLEQSIALDTVRNEYMLHTKLHAWLAIGAGGFDVAGFNERVYAGLFLTPRSDQWLGLYSDDTYMALESGGVLR